MKNIVAILVLTSCSAGLFAMDPFAAGGESPRTAQNRKWAADKRKYAVMLENSLGWVIKKKTLTRAQIEAALKGRVDSDALRDFCTEQHHEICKNALDVIAGTPTVQAFENAFVGLMFIREYGKDENKAEVTDILRQLEDTHWKVLTDAATIQLDSASQEATVDGLVACNILPHLKKKLYQGKEPNQKEVNLQEWADARRPGFKTRLEALGGTPNTGKTTPDEEESDEDDDSKTTPINDEEFGLDTPTKSWWSKAFTPKRLMTIGGIALIAAAVYYFGYSKKDAKGAKGNPQPKK